MEEIHKFWEIEDIIEESNLSTEDQKCIQYYNQSTIRREDGRYEVRLPLKQNFEDNLGNSKNKAIACFRSLERKFCKNENMQKDYVSFMDEYQSLGHMTPATTNNTTSDCFLTHHGVEREESTSTKFRVVFNASSKTSSGNSLNDLMASGPNLQQDLQSLIIKWRVYQFAFTADIEKMFRQIWMNINDQAYQKIIWRNSMEEHIKEYQLATVTYGTKAAPFLAMMTLKQLASDERSNYPNSSAPDVLEQSFYMDDLVYGQHNIKSSLQLCNDLINLLKAGGFNLRKWRSNIPELNEGNSKNSNHFNFKQAERAKTLGLSWDPQQDKLSFDMKIDQSTNEDTKRSLLSHISKLFDPLGLLAPLSTKLKLLFQNVWLSDIKWDDSLPKEIQTEWISLKDDIITNINKITINRWLQTTECDTIELHGFCDASTKAYACVIYCKVKREDKTEVTLFAGKARLVPAKSTISLPKLELSGALLLSKLMLKVKQCLSEYNIKIYGWCDSMICLGWLNGDPARWKTFVSNRVTQINDVMPPECWRYVKSDENPADCASRGLTATQLLDHPLWWEGPSWLPSYQEEEDRPTFTTDLELKKSKQVNVVTEKDINDDVIYQLLTKHNSFTKIVRILAWILRLKSKNKQDKQNYLSISELNLSKSIIIKYIQKQEFTNEINNLELNNKVSTKSKLCELNPFLDKDGILRVGGRLRNAQINHEMKHPVIIPKNSRLAELIIDESHKLVFHGGTRLTSALIRQKYWIIGGIRAVKKQLRQCVKCRRHDPVKHEQIMGDLPAARITPSRPFHHTGVDLTGFVDVKSSKGRGIKTTKGYIAVFVCMVTKAVHLELVSDLTSSTFLAALRRFAARRGAPQHIYSDNGTNFVGASRTLNQEFIDLQTTLDDKFFSAITDMEIQWHFNAPSWPSAGGLWEAAVKSLKYHLKRVIGEQKLTYEEYSTLLAQLEACLNSRPLCALTEDSEDLDFLTPSHFLASGPTLTIIETENDHRTRWQLTQKIFDDVWQRWRNEYLYQLSSRSKWRQSKENLQINDIVTINDANLPSGKWALGRIMSLHPGKDGHVRVVTLKTKNGLMKRPISKISLLPIYQDQQKPTNQQKTVAATITSNNERSRSLQQSKSRNFIYLMCLWLIMIISPAHCSYQISSLNNNHGLYFDKFANMRLEQDQWKLVIYYDMTPYWQGTELLGKYITHLDESCFYQSSKRIPQCDVVLLQLHHGFTELQHYNGILLGQQLTRPARSRRGLINGVGSIANTLFGVLDQNFAEQY
ncbi:uncharacterized protein LOC135080978 [Ostrinia nubilalis]|uniref:uncharacterized protein LOC135080978 n=1 Tax=Ostrinia nubilalis TaxID=29057 RepID=UPI0030822090